jgi:prepilin-type N-terminal cleavage/methylation domain-containing protein
MTRLERHAQDGDAGFTLIELLVVLVIMSVVGAIFTAGLVNMVNLYRVTTAVGDAQAQVGRGFQRLDTELRYAADLRTEMLAGSGSAVPSLIYVITAPVGLCYALSLVSDRLQRAHWQPGATARAVEVLVSGVGPVAGVEPFTVDGGSSSDAGDGEGTITVRPKEAAITLAVTAGGPSASHRRELRETFVAPNTIRGPQGMSLDDCLPS